MPLHFDHCVAAGGKKRISTSDRYRPKAVLSESQRSIGKPHPGIKSMRLLVAT